MNRMSPSPLVIIDASNLRVGGGVQVAASFIDHVNEAARTPSAGAKYPWLDNLRIYLSPEVRANLTDEAHPSLHLRVRARRWWNMQHWVPKIFGHIPLVSFTVFGPEYGAKPARRTIVGFADVTSIHSTPEGVAQPALMRRIRKHIRSAIAGRLNARADHLVFETAAIARQYNNTATSRISNKTIVPNAVNDVFTKRAQWEIIPKVREHSADSTTFICYPARGYSHKNHKLLGAVGHILKTNNFDAKFLVTLSPDEWSCLDSQTREHCINVGILSVNQMPTLYEMSDAAIFPSLLEAHSVTPMESLSVNGLLFASDRSFVRESCGNAPVYFNPLSAENCAVAIIETFSDQHRVKHHRSLAKNVASRLPTAEDRARAYMDLISDELKMVGEP